MDSRFTATGTEPPKDPTPTAAELLALINARLKPMSGVLRITRSRESYGFGAEVPMWGVLAKIDAKGKGPDFELEILGASLAEVCSILLDAIFAIFGPE